MKVSIGESSSQFENNSMTSNHLVDMFNFLIT